ncbi:alpha/beta hydrolase fold protein [Pelagibacterium halotolerans B2]|uniref:Alpha/beta hydrolase fold protein n=1 Tax=Pelagibacterium halotolerans (strain DSM 22347 / JCM 15775 / CGMCC 1.7692 / B2) TaxID=1082931 RepID=G4R612_PELHB|nr:alpha/beta hydrolase fold protein [Pelagibacterium halotolerans B2]
MHVHGEIADDVPPVICLPGYVRNMSDFAALPPAINRLPDTSLCFVLVDLPGRGRSSRPGRTIEYSTLTDAQCVLDVMAALDIPRAVFAGEGHGGQVAMVISARRPLAVAGTILIDSGPVTDPRSLVRTRNNFRHLTALKSAPAAHAALRKILSTDYPGESEAQLDAFAQRLYAEDARGRLQPLFDARLIGQLEKFEFDDVLAAQWPLFDTLAHAPLMIVRSHLTDQVRRATFDEMVRRRPDAATLVISDQGSPALFEDPQEHEAIAAFLRDVCRAGDALS